jgi:hypothetical protein
MANLAKMLAKRLKRAGETIQKIKEQSWNTSFLTM